MASPYAFQQASPPNAHRGISPATSALGRAPSRTPDPNGYNRYNPALYTGNGTAPSSVRRTSASPMRRQGEDGSGGGQYNPQTFGRLAGQGGAFVPRQQESEEVPPPPYSPPHSARNSPHQLYVSTPHNRQSSWSQGTSTTPTSPDPTPSTATTQQTFSPFPGASSTATTPLSANDSPSWASQTRRRGYSPPSTSPYAPSTLQHTSFPEESGTPPAASRTHSTPPQGRNGSVPPPPPGPPPASSRSASVNPPSAVRSDSIDRGAIPPPPPGPPPRSASQSRIAQLMQRTRSVISPANSRPEVPVLVSKNNTPEIPPLPSVIPPIPPKRRMETHEDSGRQRASPKHEEERQRKEVQGKEDNNPWRDAMSTPKPPPALSGSPKGINVPYVDVASLTGVVAPAPPLMSPRNAQMMRDTEPPLMSPRHLSKMDSGSPQPSPRNLQMRDAEPPQTPRNLQMKDAEPPQTPRYLQRMDSGSPQPSPRNLQSRRDSESYPSRPSHIRRDSQVSASPRNLQLLRDTDEMMVDPAEPSPAFTIRDTRRKPSSPALVTRDLERTTQLPTPPPQQASPISPEELPERTIFSYIENKGEGPSKKASGKEPVEPDFVQQTRGRYKEMLRAEAAAPTETAKLKIFLDFVEKECRFRSSIYADADPVDLRRLSKVSQIITDPDLPREDNKNLTPVSPSQDEDADGDINMASSFQRDLSSKTPRPETQWWGQNLTAASFPSRSAMSAYEQRIEEEESSRGRQSSRWWETSNEGGSCSISENIVVRSDDNDSVYGTSYPRRSRRLNRNPRQSLKEIVELASPRTSTQNPQDPSSFAGSSAFPPDRKTHLSRSRSRAPSTSRPRRENTQRRRHQLKTSLDIAPLLTLLPTWPKEYPAINNSHPRLDVFRNLVRTLNDLTALSVLQTKFSEKSQKSRDLFSSDSQRRRISQAERIQGLYQRGDLHYDEMERLNIDFEQEEAKIHHEAAEEDFKSFDAEVVTPAHRDLHERITAATAAYADLTLLIKARNPMANVAEEQPELLEYLTALKWIFDVREMLHQHVFDLLSQRNDRYKSLILNPLREARDQSRFHSTSAFFTKDSADRLAEFNKLRIQRHMEFMDLVETQVTQGVEDARSQFWEIAPLVMECLEKIPETLVDVVPIVPPEESLDHPEWVEQPMRYLEVKIAEAEGAMRGLGVEEGEGLLCLLHGVKSALARVRNEGDREERRLTEDLKEKVGMIEEEWREGLGAILERVRCSVEAEMEKVEPGRDR